MTLLYLEEPCDKLPNLLAYEMKCFLPPFSLEAIWGGREKLLFGFKYSLGKVAAAAQTLALTWGRLGGDRCCGPIPGLGSELLGILCSGLDPELL